MEAISRHSPITSNGPIYRTYGNSRFRAAVHRTCCAKGSKAQSTVTHADPMHGGTRGFCLPVLAARHEHLCFTICKQQKKGLSIVPSRILKAYVCGLAQLVDKINFFRRPRRGWWDGKAQRPNHPTTRGLQGARRRGKRNGLPVHLQQDTAGTPCCCGGAYGRG